VERTDANSILSVSLVKKAQQIEKLAKQIKDLANGLLRISFIFMRLRPGNWFSRKESSS
jgi:hypothetical protein